LFSSVIDPRKPGLVKYKLSDLLFIALCTLLSNGEDFEDMASFAIEREEWLSNWLTVPGSTPSHATFNRIFQKIDPQSLTKCLAEDGQRLIDHVKNQLINIDGKKQKGSAPKSRGNHGLFILNAWVGEHGVCIGQTKVVDKSNEITAIPELLDQLELSGNIVSIDAVGCQHKIADQIVAAEADYVLAIKGNQGDLFEEVQEAFDYGTISAHDEQWEYDHGRYEVRHCTVMPAAGYLSPKFASKWSSIKQLVRVEAQRTINDVTSSQTRYYLTSSATFTAEKLNGLVRGHWSIENQLHWHLDVTFDEDGNRARTGHAPVNLSILRKMALHRVKQDKSKLSQKKRRFKASMNVDFLSSLIHL
jgi:predicted transposase YbfD/YdcC